MAGASFSQHIFKFVSGKTAIFESILAPKAISETPFFTIQGTRGEIVINGLMTEGGATIYKPDSSGQSTVVIARKPALGGLRQGGMGVGSDLIATEQAKRVLEVQFEKIDEKSKV